MKTAICFVPVQLYDKGLTGLYSVGDVLEGNAAEQVLARYPEYFVAGKTETETSAKPAQGKE
jgi:hypothetical protein